jgi:KDO2-lipid IV(A) lauroyltransferase
MLPPHLAPRTWPTWVAIGLLRLIILLPYRFALGIGAGVGWLVYYLLPGKKRRVADVNLRLCFPELSDLERRQLARRHASHMGMGGIEAAISWWWPDERFRALGRVEGIEHILEPLAQGRGVILLSAHFSTLEIGGHLLSFEAPTQVIYRRSENAAFEYVIRKGRERHAEKVIHRDDIRTMIRSLKNGQMVWYAPDQNHRASNRVFAPFFGIPAATNPATTRLAARTGAVVVPFSTVRLPGHGGYLVRIEEALDDFPGRDPTEDATRINALFERWAREQPADYFWFHRRFRTRPPGEPKLYD